MNLHSTERKRDGRYRDREIFDRQVEKDWEKGLRQKQGIREREREREEEEKKKKEEKEEEEEEEKEEVQWRRGRSRKIFGKNIKLDEAAEEDEKQKY